MQMFVNLIADHFKICPGCTGFAPFAFLDNQTYLITDAAALPSATYIRYRSRVQLIQAAEKLAAADSYPYL